MGVLTFGVGGGWRVFGLDFVDFERLKRGFDSGGECLISKRVGLGRG